MIVSFGQNERRSVVTHSLKDLVTDGAIPRLVVHQLLVERLEFGSFVYARISGRLECRRTNNNRVIERLRRRLRSGVDAMPDRTALHEDDWMMAILPRNRRRQAEDKTSLRSADDLFEAARRQVVTFVDDHVPIVTDAIVHDAFADEALNDGHIDAARSACVRPPPIRPIDFAGTFRNVGETLDPLIQELPPMHEHQRIHAALGDQPGRDDGLAERRRGGQDAGVVLQHRLGRERLLCSELALKGGVQRVSAETLVPDDRANIQVD